MHRDTPARIAYIVSRFPKITETFILSEILELEKLGLKIELFPLMREPQDAIHPQAAAIMPRVRFSSLASRRVLQSNWWWLRNSPKRYAKAWCRGVWGNRSSGGFLLRALMIVPLAAHLAREMQRLEIDHVHGAWATHPALAAYVVHLLTGIPYSFTIHSHELYIDRTMLEEKIDHAEWYTTISEYNRRMIASLYGDRAVKHLRVVHCGVRPDVFVPVRRPRNDVFTIVCVASLERHKGQTYLLEACRHLRDTGVSFRCMLVGDGPDRAMLTELAVRFGIQRDVQFLGRQPTNRVIEILQQADVVTLQSVMMPSGMSEGIPVSLMEAMACGRPVIASHLRGIPELVEHEKTGLIVRPGDAHALACALLRIRNDVELAARLARAGRDKVVRDFDLTVSAERLYELFTGRSAVFAEGLSA